MSCRKLVICDRPVNRFNVFSCNGRRCSKSVARGSKCVGAQGREKKLHEKTPRPSATERTFGSTTF